MKNKFSGKIQDKIEEIKEEKNIDEQDASKSIDSTNDINSIIDKF